MLTNGGTTRYVNGTIEVWYHPKGIANILSLKTLTMNSTVSFAHSDSGNAFVASFDHGRTWRFKQSTNGLYCYDHVGTGNPSNSYVVGYSFISTVASNESSYHRREVESARLAGKLHRLLGRPSQEIFEKAVSTNQMKNCPITIENVKRYFLFTAPMWPLYKVKPQNVTVAQL